MDLSNEKNFTITARPKSQYSRLQSWACFLLLSDLTLRRHLFLKTMALAAVIVIALITVLPTLHILPKSFTDKFPWQGHINLGLDLQGGSYLAYNVDIEKALN